MTKRLVLALGLLTVVSAPAIGQEFDTSAHCKRVAGVTGNHSYMIEKSCRQMEASAKAELQSMSIAPEIRAHCIRVATTTGAGSYSIMRSCVDMEASAKRSLRP